MSMRIGSLLVLFALVQPGSAEPSASVPVGLEGALADSDPRIMEVPMQEWRILRIPTHKTVTTTISFPEPITGLDGAGFVIDPDKERGEFLLSYSPGANYVSLTPQTETARRNLNVVVGTKVIVLEPYPVASYQMAVAAVKFFNRSENLVLRPGEPVPMAKGVRPLEGAVSAAKLSNPPKPAFENAGVAKLLGTMDTLKTLSGLKGAPLEEALRVMPHIQFADHSQAEVADFGEYSIRLDRVIRNNKIDCLAFAVTVTNKTDLPVVFDPDSFQVRVGKEVFPKVVCDLNPHLGAGLSTVGYFAIITSPSGSPNYLAVDNEFHVSLNGGVVGGVPAVKRQPSTPSKPIQESAPATAPAAPKPTPAPATAPVAPTAPGQPKPAAPKGKDEKTQLIPVDDDVIEIKSPEGKTRKIEVLPSKKP